jgi:DNA polymerase III delta prime subunit
MNLWGSSTTREFEDLSYNLELNQKLQQLALSSMMPHLLFYGPDGVGKSVRIRIFLASWLGEEIWKMVN